MEPEQINPTPVTQPAVVIEEQVTKKPSKLLVYLLFILIILGLASWAGVYLKKENVNEVQIVNETDNWKTYRNEEYGFEFKYPVDWMVSTSTQTIIINSKTNAKKIADFEMRNMDTDAGPRDDIAVLLPTDRIIVNLEEYISYEKRKEFFLDTKPITVGGLSGYDFTEIGFSGVYTILLDSKSNFYEIIFGYRGSRGELSDVEKKILSTFKFIDKTDISNWKTYRNEEYGFEFRYPKEAVVPDTPIMSGNVVILEIGMSNGIFIFPKGEYDYGYDKQPVISDVEIGGLKAKKQFWESDQRIEYKIIDPAKNWIPCGKDLKNCNRISIQWETKEQLEFLNQILSTFKFTN